METMSIGKNVMGILIMLNRLSETKAISAVKTCVESIRTYVMNDINET